jgi:hypothetical protein
MTAYLLFIVAIAWAYAAHYRARAAEDRCDRIAAMLADLDDHHCGALCSHELRIGSLEDRQLNTSP